LFLAIAFETEMLESSSKAQNIWIIA